MDGAFIDTHAHLSAEEFDADRAEVAARAKTAGCVAVLLPAINLSSLPGVMRMCRDYPGFAYPMVGLHPEEVRGDYENVIAEMMTVAAKAPFIAIGEVGLDFYWTREYEKEQLGAFERQVEWSADSGLPLMIHCRKAQNEMVKILRRYERRLPGGVFHCFTGNEKEAAELLSFRHFALGIGGVLTFKKSHLPEVLPKAVPLDRIVLETDAPYMAPAPMRGKRNESAFLPFVIARLARCYGVTGEEICRITTDTARSVFKNIS